MKLSKLSLILGLPLALAACGDDGGGGAPDASDVDAGPRADAAPTGDTCSVQIIDSEGIFLGDEVGLIASFNRPDGSLIGTAATDADGIATRDDCVADTMVTMGGRLGFIPGARGLAGTVMFTVANVQPGDTAVIGYDEPSGPSQWSYADIDGEANVTSGLTENLWICGSPYTWNSGTTSHVYMGSPYCQGGTPGTFDVLATTRDNTNSEYISMATAIDVPWVNMGNSPGTLSNWTAVTPLQDRIRYSVENLPALANYLEWGTGQVRNFISYSGTGTGDPASGGPYDLVFKNLPASFFDTIYTYLYVDFSDQIVFGTTVAERYSQVQLGHASAAGFTLNKDATATLLPRLAGVLASSSGDHTRPTLTWFGDGSFEGTNGGIFRVAWGPNFPNDDSDPDGIWLFVTADAASGTLTAPELPEGLLPFAPDRPVQAYKGHIFAHDYTDYSTLINTGIIPDALEEGFIPGIQPPGGASSTRVTAWETWEEFGGCGNAGGPISSTTLGVFLLMLFLRLRRRREDEV